MASKQQQVAEVVEGLGLGLVVLGRTRVSSWKLDLEFAFSHAWRRWEHAAEYPSIGGAPKPDNVFWIGVTRSERRRGAAVVWSKNGGEYKVSVALDGWTPEEASRHVGDRPIDEWVSLARAFCERLDKSV